MAGRGLQLAVCTSSEWGLASTRPLLFPFTVEITRMHFGADAGQKVHATTCCAGLGVKVHRAQPPRKRLHGSGTPPMAQALEKGGVGARSHQQIITGSAGCSLFWEEGTVHTRFGARCWALQRCWSLGRVRVPGTF